MNKIRGGLALYKGAAQFKWSRFGLSVRNILLRDSPISVNVADISFSLIPKGAVVADLWSGLRFERSELQFILGVLQPGMNFMDIGSNVGLFAIAAAKKIEHGKVYAFEPCASTFQILKENIRFNALNNIIAVPRALGDRKGQAIFYINARGKDGLNTMGRPAHPDCQIVSQELIQVTTLDDFLEDHGISRIDVMKVDVEGAELLVFRGGIKLLQRRDAPLILYESYCFCTKGFNYHPVEIMWLLEQCGYSFFVLDGKINKIIPRQPEHGYDVMLVAVKPFHPSFPGFRGMLDESCSY
jgi:FkbM family methyltransferase